MFWLVLGVCVHWGSFSALGTSVSLLAECVMDTVTAPLEQMRLSVQVKVQIIIHPANVKLCRLYVELISAQSRHVWFESVLKFHPFCV